MGGTRALMNSIAEALQQVREVGMPAAPEATGAITCRRHALAGASIM